MTVADLDLPPDDFAVTVVETSTWRSLVVRLGAPHDVLSWALVNGGRGTADIVAWREVRLAELGPTVDAAALLRDSLTHLGAPRAVGLLTARDVRRHELERAEGEASRPAASRPWASATSSPSVIRRPSPPSTSERSISSAASPSG